MSRVMSDKTAPSGRRGVEWMTDIRKRTKMEIRHEEMA